jgi:hypothetical protein
MAPMGDHSTHEAAGAPLRKARAWAWIVFWSTAGTSVLYNVYHALVTSHLHWYIGIPEGFLPLLLAIGMLEVAAAWPEKMQAVAWLVTAGAMAWSAVAIGAVIRQGAPLHAGFLFGLLADTAALGAMYFLLNGPTAAQAIAKMDEKVAGLLGQIAAERSARAEAEAAHGREMAGLRAELTAAGEAAEAQMAEARRVHRMTVSVLDERVNKARSETEAVAARAEALTRKLEAADRKLGRGNTGTGSRKQAGSGSRKPEASPAPAASEGGPQGVPEAPPDLDAESAVLWYVDQGLSASAAGVKAGLSDSRGRQIVRKLTAPAPAGVDPVTGAANGGSGAEAGGGND